MLPTVVVEQVKKRKWLLLLAAAFLIPYFAFQNMRERKAAEQAAQAADDAVPGVVALLGKDGPAVQYQNGATLPFDGVGFAVLTLDDYKKTPDRLKGVQLKDDQFPVVAFFNAGGFDSSGEPVVVRKAADGSVLHEMTQRPKKPVAWVQAKRDGTFAVRFWDRTDASATADEFYRTYVGSEPAPDVPPPEALDKMTDAELAKVGLTRMSKAEYDKKFADKPAAPATGVRGKLIRVGGVPAVSPLGGVKVVALKGVVDPTQTPPAAEAEATTDAEGGFSLPLPDGTYTVVANVDGQWKGNAVNAARWPATQVGGAWVEFEFRVAK